MYAKVFAQIFDSSIANNYQLRHFFTDMLVLAEIDGVVDMTHEAISARTRIPLEQVVKYLHDLEQPDPRSRSHREDGRRLIRIDPLRDWGWRIVNYEDYRNTACEEQRRELTRNRTRKWRETKQKETRDAPVTHSDASDAMQRQRQRQTDKQKEKKIKDSTVIPPLLSESPEFLKAWERWLEHLKQKRKPATLHAQDLQLLKLSKLGVPLAIATINQSIERNWQGLFELKQEYGNNRTDSGGRGQPPPAVKGSSLVNGF